MSLREIRDILKGARNIIDIGFANIDFIAPKHVIEAAKKALDEGLTRYAMPVEGDIELRMAIAEKISKDNRIDVEPHSEVLVTEGGSTAIYTVMKTLVGPGDEVIMSNPVYSAFSDCVKLAGGIPINVQVNEERNFRIDPEAIEENVTPRTKAIVLVSPDNPTGSVLTKDDLEAIAEVSKKHNLMLVSDETYGKIVFDDRKYFSVASLPNMKERTIIINTFSKSYVMPGFRIGYVVANESLMKRIAQLSFLIVTCPNSIGQKAALAAITGPEEPYKVIWKEFEERRNIMADGLNSISGITCKRPGGSIFVYPNVKSFNITSFEFAKHIAKEARVLVYPATVFGTGGEGYLRVCITTNRDGIYSSSASRSNITEAIKRIEETVEKLV